MGAHEVIIESPRHVLDVTELEADRLATVIRVYRDRLRHWAADPRLKHGLIFKNSGYAAGASLEHVHSQLVALPYVPDVVQAELDGADRYFAAHARCIFCDLISSEAGASERLVTRREGFVAFSAYAGRQPYETWILPEGHASRFDELTDAGARELAGILQDVLRRLHAQSPPAAYNLILHTSPFDQSRGEAYHWHWELVPRFTNLAGLEIGAGAFINPLSPEHAARNLRNASIPPSRSSPLAGSETLPLTHAQASGVPEQAEQSAKSIAAPRQQLEKLPIGVNDRAKTGRFSKLERLQASLAPVPVSTAPVLQIAPIRRRLDCFASTFLAKPANIEEFS